MHHRITALCAAVTLALALGGCDQFKDAKDAVRHTMPDPDSAQFRDVEQCGGDSKIVHGEVNGKNRYGAYDGFKHFFYAEYQVAFASDREFSALLDRCYNRIIVLGRTASAAPTEAAVASPVAQKPDLRPQGPIGEPMDHYTAEDEAALEAATVKASRDRCWHDYCPCDTSDPDYGGADVSICRNLKGGVPVEDAVLAAGAAFRDGRRQMREAKAEF